jgi:hypothetical protein
VTGRSPQPEGCMDTHATMPGMTAVHDLDRPPLVTLPAPARVAWLTAIGVVVAIVLNLGTIAVALRGDPPSVGVQPRIWLAVDQRDAATLEADGYSVTAIAYYVDGTRGDAYRGLEAGPGWVPDRPVSMIVLAGPGSCSISIDGNLVASEGAAVNRLAVCVWRAPS